MPGKGDFTWRRGRQPVGQGSPLQHLAAFSAQGGWRGLSSRLQVPDCGGGGRPVYLARTGAGSRRASVFFLWAFSASDREGASRGVARQVGGVRSICRTHSAASASARSANRQRHAPLRQAAGPRRAGPRAKGRRAPRTARTVHCTAFPATAFRVPRQPLSEMPPFLQSVRARRARVIGRGARTGRAARARGAMATAIGGVIGDTVLL